MKQLNLLVAAGGTGGHLFPALAVAEELKSNPALDFNAFFVGNNARIEGRTVPNEGYTLTEIPMSGLKGKFNPSNILVPFRILQSVNICSSLIKKHKIDAVLAAGAYLSYPAGISATMNNIPLILMESNVYPGKTIKALSSRASLIITAFEETKKYLKTGRKTEILNLGNPVRNKLINAPDRETSHIKFGLEPSKKTILIFGGSLGAKSINQAAEKSIEIFGDKYNFIWQTGTQYKPTTPESSNVKILNFINDMASAYSAADLVIARAGATSLAEIAIAAKPSVLIPYPQAANDHQEYNADLFDKSGAAIKIADRRVYDVLHHIIEETVEDITKLTFMSIQAKMLGKPEATKNVADSILKLLKI